MAARRTLSAAARRRRRRARRELVDDQSSGGRGRRPDAGAGARRRDEGSGGLRPPATAGRRRAAVSALLKALVVDLAKISNGETSLDAILALEAAEESVVISNRGGWQSRSDAIFDKDLTALRELITSTLSTVADDIKISLSSEFYNLYYRFFKISTKYLSKVSPKSE